MPIKCKFRNERYRAMADGSTEKFTQFRTAFGSRTTGAADENAFLLLIQEKERGPPSCAVAVAFAVDRMIVRRAGANECQVGVEGWGRCQNKEISDYGN